MLRFPYGIADFRKIRDDGMFYLDRTRWIREIERLGQTLVFLRPRRFGKSLWLQTLATYYDLRFADHFERFFGGLDIAREPSGERRQYFVLQWNFSKVSARGDSDQIAARLHSYINNRIRDFTRRYQGHLPGTVHIGEDATDTLRHLLEEIIKTPYKLCLLIDEYDNIVNDIMVQDVAAYRALFDKDGPFKEIFKSIKSATEGNGLERVFVTGVTPLALNDLTSGFNTARDVSQHPALAGLCGFREQEIREVLHAIADQRNLTASSDELLATMRTWYNGYCFSEEPGELVYNPTNALHFLNHLAEFGHPPRELHDRNLRTDRSKLAFLARTTAGAGLVEQLTEGDGHIGVRRIQSGFSPEDLLTGVGEDDRLAASLLYYMGLLTRTQHEPARLHIPNLAVRKLFLDRLLQMALPRATADRGETERAAEAFFASGELDQLLRFFEQTLLPVLSNRDRGAAPQRPELSGSGVNEMTIKALFLAILFDDTRFSIFSELELDRGYADLCLLVRPDQRRDGLFDMIFEFKLVCLAELGKAGRELRGMTDDALVEQAAVAAALAAAKEQVGRYRDALMRKVGPVRPRGYVVVAVGLERMVGAEA